MTPSGCKTGVNPSTKDEDEIIAMIYKKLIIMVFILLLALIESEMAFGLELETKYATIQYSDIKDLRKFNRKLKMGSLGYMLSGKKNETVEDEVRNKIDVIVEKVRTVLEMFPRDMKFRIMICESMKGVQEEFKRIYSVNVGYLAFYSPVENRVFYSAKNITLRVVAHEIGHVVVENYHVVSPPVKIHEVLAQYAEMHVTD